MKTSALINGVTADYLNVNDRAIHYGDGLFETILCSENKLLYWSQHYLRLQRSAQRLKLRCPDEDVLLGDIRCLLKLNETPGSKVCSIKIIITRGSSDRGYVIPKKTNEKRIVLMSALAADYSSLLSGELLSGELYICKNQVSINESLAGLKHLSRLENVLARNEWNDTANNQFIDGLMLNARQQVIEGSMSNVFAIKENNLYTPDLSQSGVNGIMRDMIIDAAGRNNIQLSMLNLKLEDLYEMEEIFISNSLMGIRSVNKIDASLYQQQTLTKFMLSELLKTKDDHVQIVK